MTVKDVFLDREKERKKQEKKELNRQKRALSFIEQAKLIHGNNYRYDRVMDTYINNKKSVEIYCNNCGEYFLQAPRNHLDGHRCVNCMSNFNTKKTIEDFILLSKSKYGDDRFDYSKAKYVNTSTPLELHCNKCGRDFLVRPVNHLYLNQGCPYCSGNKMDTRIFIEKASLIHGGSFNYDKSVYVDSITKVLIHCNECNNDFLQLPKAHLRGQGCPHCRTRRMVNTKFKNGTFNSSRLQNLLYHLLVEVFGKYNVVCEYNEDDRYPFNCDFYVKSEDLFIELNGFFTHNSHWFDETDERDVNLLKVWQKKAENSNFYKNAIDVWTKSDLKKREQARKNNLNYVVFWDGKANKNGLTAEIEQWFEDGCRIRKDWK